MMGDNNSFINRTIELNARSENLISESWSWIDKAIITISRGEYTEDISHSARHLPGCLSSHVMALCSHRATEFSGDIGLICILAAKVALIIFEKTPSELATYEHDVRYDLAYAEFKNFLLSMRGANNIPSATG